MPSINFTSNGVTAFNLWGLTNKLKGDDPQFKARERVRGKILAVWPELGTTGLTPEEEAARVVKLQETRSIEINPFEQTALAEGILKWLKDMDLEDGAKSAVMGLAKLCRFSGWLDKQIDKKELRAFDESDEAVELDAEEPATEVSAAA